MEKQLCPFCQTEQEFNDGDKIMFHCKNCGTFLLESTLYDSLIEYKDSLESEIKNNLHLISGYLNEATKTNNRFTISSKEDLLNILNSPLICRTPAEKANKFLLYLYKQNQPFGHMFCKRNLTNSICYAFNETEFIEIIIELINQNLLETEYIASNNPSIISRSFKLTFKGHQYCEELIKNTPVKSNQAFVAMWFGDSEKDSSSYESKKGMDDVFDKAIQPAAENCDFKAYRVDNKEHNNDITDEIIAGIKESRFVIADLTGNRGGVYYEAGFAKGLGKEVIFTCHENWFNGKDSLHRVHFDINHINMIVWKDIDELKKKLINRIRATIL